MKRGHAVLTDNDENGDDLGAFGNTTERLTTPQKRVAQSTTQLVFNTNSFSLHSSPSSGQYGQSSQPNDRSQVREPQTLILCADCRRARDLDSMDVCVYCQNFVCSICSVRRDQTVCLNCI